LGWVAAVAVFLWQKRGLRGNTWLRALWFGTAGGFGALLIAGFTGPAIGYEHSLLLNTELALLARMGDRAAGEVAPGLLGG